MATSLIPLKNSTVWKDADMVPTSGDPITAEWITSVMGNIIMASLGLEKTAVAYGSIFVPKQYSNTDPPTTITIASDKTDGIDSFANTGYYIHLIGDLSNIDITNKTTGSFGLDNYNPASGEDAYNVTLRWYAIGERG